DISAGGEQLAEQFQIAAGFSNAPAMTGNAPAFAKGQQNLRLALGSSGYGAIAESAEPWQYLASDQARQAEVENGGAKLYVTGGRSRADGYVRLGSYKKVAFRPTTFPQVDNLDPKKSNSIEQKFEYYIYDRDEDGVWQCFRLPTDPTILICVAAGDFARRLDDL